MYELIKWLKENIAALRGAFETYLFEQLTDDAIYVMLQKKLDEEGNFIMPLGPNEVVLEATFRYEITGNESDAQRNLKTILNHLRDFEEALDLISKTELYNPNTWLQGLWGGLSAGFSIVAGITAIVTLWPYISKYIYAMTENYYLGEASLAEKIYTAVNSFFSYFPLFGVTVNSNIEEQVKNTAPNPVPTTTSVEKSNYEQMKDDLYQFNIRFQKINESEFPWFVTILNTFQYLIKAMISANKLLAEDQNGTLRERMTTTLTTAINSCEYIISQLEALGFKQQNIAQFKNILGALKHIENNLKVGTVAQAAGTALNLIVALDTNDPEKLSKVNLELTKIIDVIDKILASNLPVLETTVQLIPLVNNIYQLTGDPELLLDTLKKLELPTEQLNNLANILVKLNQYNGEMACFFDEAEEGTLNYANQTLVTLAQVVKKQTSNYLDLAGHIYGTNVAPLIKDTNEKAPYYQTRIAAAEKRLAAHPSNQKIEKTIQELKEKYANSMLKNFTESLEINYENARTTLAIHAWKSYANKFKNEHRVVQIHFLKEVSKALQNHADLKDLPMHIKLHVYLECLKDIKNEIRGEKNMFNSALEKIVTEQIEEIAKNPLAIKTDDLTPQDTALIKATYEQLKPLSAQPAPHPDTTQSMRPSAHG